MENKLVSKMKDVLNVFSKKEGGIVDRFSSFNFSTNSYTQVGQVSYSPILARQMYEGESEFYEGDYFATKTVNQTKNTVSIPLNDNFKQYKSTLMEVLENILIGDDQFVRISITENPNSSLFPEQKVKINMINYPAAQIKEYTKENGILKEIVIKGEDSITQIINEKQIITKKENETKEVLNNQFGFVPVIHIEERSEIKPIANLIRAYHIISKDSKENFQKNAKPKIKLKVKTFEKFIKNNFSEKEISNGQINFKNKGSLILEQDDNAEYVKIESTTQDAKSLLHLIFYAIIAVSEIPEFLFGTHIQSSKASTEEQQLPFRQKIGGIRTELEEDFQLLNRMLTIINAKINGEKPDQEKLTEEIKWPKILRNQTEEVELLKGKTEALQKSIMDGYMSRKTAHNEISQYIETLESWEEEEKQILKEKINGDKELAQYMQFSKGV